MHNMSLGVIKRLTLTTFDIIRPQDKRHLSKPIDAFNFKAAGLQFVFTGRRVIRCVKACPLADDALLNRSA